MFTTNNNKYHRPQNPRPAFIRRLTARSAVTLIEMLVTSAIGSFVLTSILTTGVTLSDTMVAISNYCDLNQDSRRALDMMSADIRNTAIVTSITDRQVTVSNILTGNVISYSWDGSDKFVRNYNGTRMVMLDNCDYLKISGYQRNPTNNFEFLPASTAAQTKLISISWRCSRQILGAKLNTESVQTAQICIRN